MDDFIFEDFNYVDDEEECMSYFHEADQISD